MNDQVTAYVTRSLVARNTAGVAWSLTALNKDAGSSRSIARLFALHGFTVQALLSGHETSASVCSTFRTHTGGTMR